MDDEAKRNLQIVKGDFLSALNDIRKLRGQAPLSALPEPPFCSFCGQSKDEVQALIAGDSAFICNECVVMCRDIIGPPPPAASWSHTA